MPHATAYAVAPSADSVIAAVWPGMTSEARMQARIYSGASHMPIVGPREVGARAGAREARQNSAAWAPGPADPACSGVGWRDLRSVRLEIQIMRKID